MLISIASFALWIGDAAMDAFVFRIGTFSDVLLPHLSAHEICSRSLLIASLVTVGVVLARTVLKRNLAENAFQESNETLLKLADAAEDAIVLIDYEGRISFWNRAAERIFGYPSHEALGRELHVLLAPQRYQRTYQGSFLTFRDSGLDSTSGRTLELRAVRKGGPEFPVELSLSTLQLKGKWHAVGLLRDITERKRSDKELRKHRQQLEHLVTERTEELHAVNEVLRREINDRIRTEEELCRSENFLNIIFDSIHDPFSIVNREYRIIKFNDAYARLRDKRADELIGKKCYEALYSRPGICDECIVDRTFQSKDPCAKEKQLTLSDGSTLWIEIYTYPIFDHARNVSYVIEYTRNITDRKQEEEEKKRMIATLNHLSSTDGLTGLLNRRALNDMLKREIDRATRYSTDLSLVLCDIDRFKYINDTFGHTAGDRTLLSVAASIRSSLRKADIVGRYGGDEFMIILPETSLAGAKRLADKIRRTVEGLDLEIPWSKQVRVTLSMGVASCCAPVENIDTFVALADTALYASKEAGRNRVSIIKG
ncbi:MAG: diguanylate cyclase [Nitrospirae bacterium]|nr:diguanylate cyclase [Nitrospirota bacterium]